MSKEMDKIINRLEKDFQKMEVLFDNPKWRFYKFGKGGPWNGTLKELQTKTIKYDKKIFNHFIRTPEIEVSSYNRLLTLCLHLGVVKTPQEGYKSIKSFQRQLTMMKLNPVQGGGMPKMDRDGVPIVLKKGYTFAEQQVIDKYGVEMLEALNKSGFKGSKK